MPPLMVISFRIKRDMFRFVVIHSEFVCFESVLNVNETYAQPFQIHKYRLFIVVKMSILYVGHRHNDGISSHENNRPTPFISLLTYKRKKVEGLFELSKIFQLHFSLN